MISIKNVLKKYSLGIIFTVCLVAIQANCELTLPDYTSKIVNVGIQQGGIQSINFEFISKDKLENIKVFTNHKEDEIIEQSYIFDNNLGYYKLKNINTEEKEELEKILKLPTVLNYYIETGVINVKSLGFNSSEELFDAFSYMSDAEAQVNVNYLTQKIDLEENLINQIGINAVKEEYIKLGIDVDELQMNYIVKTGLQMLGIAFAAAIITIITAFLSSKIAAFFARDLRKAIAEKVMTYANDEFIEISTASLITRSTNDVTQVQNLLMMSMRILCFAPIMGIGAVLKVWGNSLSWIIITAVSFIFIFIVFVFFFVTPKFKIVQKAIDKLNLISREFISGIPVIRAFSNEVYQEKKFDKANKNLTKISLFLNKITSLLGPMMNLVMNLTCILIIWFGAKKVDLGSIQVGTLIAFITYTIHIIMSFLMISMFSIILPRAFVSIKRINEILKKDSSIKNKEKLLSLQTNKRGTVEFKDVYFRYKDAEEDVLENISFKVEAGTTTAFIGSTGSGKSTLINLIPRFSDVTGGKILVNGVDIRDVDVAQLRRIIGFVPQKGMLFSGDIKSNISLGVDDLSKKDLELAAQISCADEFIQQKDDQYNSVISQGGTNVSGGQRQRLAIARAVAKKPEIYIFDDSFSALDYKTDAKVRRMLDKYTKGSTKLIVAQRISTVRNADQIIVMDEGRIVDIGTHKDLLKRCNIYREIAKSQLKEANL